MMEGEKVVGSIFLIVLLIAGGWYWFTYQREIEVTATATKFQWMRSIYIDEYRTVRESGWNVPQGARLISTERKQRGTRTTSIKPLITVPNFDNWYTYDIDRWVPINVSEVGGHNRDDPVPHWQEVQLNCAGQLTLGCQRENHRVENYFVIFTDNQGKEYIHLVSYADWQNYQLGQEYTLKVNSFGVQNDPLYTKE